MAGFYHYFRQQRGMATSACGFTLLEIMLVLLIMAVVSAMVLPNIFSPPSARLADEGRYLRQVLYLAAEEAQLRGIAMRWSAYKGRYIFEMPDAEGAWQPMSEKPFAPYSLPEGIHIESVQLQNGLPWPDTQTEQDAAVGRVTLFPDGMLTLADITLAAKSSQLRIQLRPGPDGIHIVAP